MLLTLATLTALAPQGPGTSLAPVVINEFAYDDSGTDDKEFVELFNRSNAPVDLSNWTIECIEGTSPGGSNSVYTIASGVIIPAGGYVVIGTATVPNLTPGTPAASVNWLENSSGPDGIVLADSTATVVDSVLWCTALWTAPIPTFIEGAGLNGRVFAGDSAANPNFTTCQRRVDGFDTDNNGFDFVYMGWTPGTANGSANALVLNHVQRCDGTAGGDLSSDFAVDAAAAPAVFGLTWTYEFPFGEGRKYSLASNALARTLASGWAINGFLRYQSGNALALTGPTTLASLGYLQRANYIGGTPQGVTDPGSFNPSTDRYINRDAFAAPGTFELGNTAPTIDWLRGFTSKSESFQLTKMTKLGERTKLELGADFSNPFNFHRWGAPNTSVTSAAFGIVSTAAQGRQVQISASLKF